MLSILISPIGYVFYLARYQVTLKMRIDTNHLNKKLLTNKHVHHW